MKNKSKPLTAREIEIIYYMCGLYTSQPEAVAMIFNRLLEKGNQFSMNDGTEIQYQLSLIPAKEDKEKINNHKLHYLDRNYLKYKRYLKL